MIIKPDLRFNGTLVPLEPSRIRKIILHHAAHPTWTVWDVHRYHRDNRGWMGIGYNYFIHKDGQIYEGRGLNIGAHAGPEWNPQSIGISCQGYLHDDKANIGQKMTDAQVNSVAWLCAKFIKQFNLSESDVIGHRDTKATACPGNRFRWDDVRAGISEELTEEKEEEKMKRIPVEIEGIDREFDGLLDVNKSYIETRAVLSALGIDFEWRGSEKGLLVIPPEGECDCGELDKLYEILDALDVIAKHVGE